MTESASLLMEKDCHGDTDSHGRTTAPLPPAISGTVAFFQVASLMLMLTSVFVIFLEIISESTLVGQMLHPAAALFLLGVTGHVLWLWEGLLAALPSLTDERDAAISYVESHPYTYKMVQLAQDRMSRLVSGAQAWRILLTLLLVPCATVSRDDAPLPRKVASILCLSFWLASAQRMAYNKASVCRLDTLNAPVYLALSAVSLNAHPLDFLHLLRWSWHQRAEKPVVTLSFSFVPAFFTAAIFGAAIYVLFSQVTLLQGLAVISLMSLHGIVQAIAYASANLSTREQQVALSETTRVALTRYPTGRHVWTTLCLISLGFLTTPRDKLNVVPMAWLSVASTAFVTAMVTEIFQVLATDFAVAFLTFPPVTVFISWSAYTAPLTSATTLLQGLYHATYQEHDDLYYMGTREERLAWKLQQEEDVESPRAVLTCPAKIASYPTPTNNPDVFEEHEF